jgi:hypothetical protein
LTITTGSQSLAPGVHCGAIVVGYNATLTLLPGDHYFFAASLTLQNQAILQGTDVALIFDATSFFTFKHNSDIELEGRKSGLLAGFVIATTCSNMQTFTTSANLTLNANYTGTMVPVPTGVGPSGQTSHVRLTN